jgi:hypothetical protein
MLGVTQSLHVSEMMLPEGPIGEERRRSPRFPLTVRSSTSARA